jgi:DMSO/TMAO reductase YedYZ heme-binding membrane subunit
MKLMYQTVYLVCSPHFFLSSQLDKNVSTLEAERSVEEVVFIQIGMILNIIIIIIIIISSL